MTEVPPAGSSDPRAKDPYERLIGLPLGTHVEIRSPGGTHWRGWLLPPDALSSPRTVRLKLASGYNLGVLVDPSAEVTVIPGPPWGEPSHPHPDTPGEPLSPAPTIELAANTVAILTTGGTIASRVDYTSGGVHPVHGLENIAQLYPGIKEGGPLVVRPVAEILSEDMSPAVWETLARDVEWAFSSGVRGVVVSHGTDTLAYTASALSFVLRDLPGPVVLVGAQRSIDRPSSDGVENMVAAVRAAREADLAEVVVAMHAGPSDGTIAIHRGTRVRKMHSTRRDAFRTLNGDPIGHVDPSGVRLERDHTKRAPRTLRIAGGFRERAALVWFRPGLTPEQAEQEIGQAEGVVLAGTGLGHVARSHLEWVRRASERGVVIAMTTQCLEGEVDPFVYSRGRELLQAGVAFLGDCSPETAYVKMLWALHGSPGPVEVRRRLLQSLAGEFGDRRSLPEPLPVAPSAGGSGSA
jgi:glutamyl-tRNA(Gln) amidotransferase subunit D